MTIQSLTDKIHSRHRLRPYGFQHEAYRFIHYHGAVYLMLDMGMGKTRICIEVGRTLECPMFIVAPKFAAIETWPEEFKKWDSSAKFTVLHGPHKEQRWANSTKYTNIIINYDGLKWFNKITKKQLRPLQRYMFVYDEASMLKNYESVRWMIAADMLNISSQYRVCLSGTPLPNNMTDLWSQYYLLDKGKALCPNYFQFRSRFFDYTGADGEPPYQTTIKPFAEEKIFDLIKPITMRLAAKDYLSLPKLLFNPIKITMPAKFRKQYKELEEEFMLEFPDATVIANSAAVRDHKLRQFLQGAIYSTIEGPDGSRHRAPKANYVHSIKAEILKQILESSAGSPMLIAVQFKFEIGILKRVLKREIPHITGSTSGAEGQRLIKEWNKGKLPFLVVHPKSVGYSLNLQFGGNHLVYMALPWELDLYLQLIKRLHRQGQLSKSVTVTTIAFKNTIDDKLADYLLRKDQTQEGLFSAMLRR